VSSPPLPAGLADTRVNRVANRFHSAAIHLLRRARAVDRASGLTAERLSLLSVLAYAGPMTVSGLAEAEQVSRPAISRSLKSLQRLGLARTERGTADRRQVRVRATAKGRRLMEEGRKRRLSRIAADLADLDDGEIAALEEAVRVLEALEG
jgi:DNA-binding MarR family transcriptional regulator